MRTKILRSLFSAKILTMGNTHSTLGASSQRRERKSCAASFRRKYSRWAIPTALSVHHPSDENENLAQPLSGENTHDGQYPQHSRCIIPATRTKILRSPFPAKILTMGNTRSTLGASSQRRERKSCAAPFR